MHVMIAWILTLLLTVGSASPSRLPAKPVGQQDVTAQQQQLAPAQQPAKPDGRGTRISPLIIAVPKSNDESRNDARERSDYYRDAHLFGWVTFWTLVVQSIIFGIQAWVFRWQGTQLKASVEAMNKASKEQREDLTNAINANLKISNAQQELMQSSIAEAANATQAMNEVATQIAISADAAQRSVAGLNTMREFSTKQARAYVHVDFGSAHWQEGIFLFGSEPSLINVGNTPARSVRHKMMAAALAPDLPDDFVFDDSTPWIETDITLAPHKPTPRLATTKGQIPEADVENVFTQKLNIYVWGTVEYKDIFGDLWRTNFCHRFVWMLENKAKDGEPVQFRPVIAYMNQHRRHNDAT